MDPKHQKNVTYVSESKNSLVDRGVTELGGLTLMPFPITNSELGPTFWQDFAARRVAQRGGIAVFEGWRDSGLRLGQPLHGGSETLLRCRFGLTADLIQTFAAREREMVRTLQEQELAMMAIGSQDAAITGFSADCLNLYNQAFYGTSDCWKINFRPAATFVDNRPINYALSQLVQQRIDAPEIRIKELAAGGSARRWPAFVNELAPGRTLSVTLTDLPCGLQLLPPDVSGRAQFTAHGEDLLDDFKPVPEKERQHVILATYAMDSVWFPGDRQYRYVNGKFYTALHRLRVADDVPNRASLLAAAKVGETLRCGQAADLEGILIDSVFVETDIDLEPFGASIRERAESHHLNEIGLNMPAGLIHKVQNAFDTQLTRDGIFVVGDVAQFNESADFESGPYNTSGAFAKFKIEDYYLAKQILEKLGFRVEILSILDFVTRHLGNRYCELPEYRDLFVGHESNCVMVVSRT